ncbi:hypothetical protein INT48_004849, partial [Thamnidium elegans]
EIEEKNDKMENDLMTIMVKDLASYVCKHNVSIPMSSEASFSEKYIMPAVRRILLENADKNIVYSLIDKPEDTGKKPDFMIGAKKRRTELYFFYMEVKRPDTTSRYQVEDDHTKLLKFMKESIDKQLRLGIEDPMSLGLLVEDIISLCVPYTRKKEQVL